MNTALAYPSFEKIVHDRKSEYQNAAPYPHTVIENFLDPEMAAEASREIDSLQEHTTYYRHYNSKKYACNDLSKMGPATRAIIEELQSPKFIQLVSELSGIKNLIPDPTLEGGGIHILNESGFLNIHTDFLSHAKFRNWGRRINVLVYLNADWKEEYQGQLELWDRTGKIRVKSITPELNRCVIFSTIEKSYHGNPRPVQEPNGRARKSIALYYYTEEKTDLKLKATDYISLPEKGMTGKVANFFDKAALKAIVFSKRYLGISNEGITGLIKKVTHWFQ